MGLSLQGSENCSVLAAETFNTGKRLVTGLPPFLPFSGRFTANIPDN